MIRREFEKVACRQIKILKAFIQYRFYILCSLFLKASQTSTIILFKDVSFAKLQRLQKSKIASYSLCNLFTKIGGINFFAHLFFSEYVFNSIFNLRGWLTRLSCAATRIEILQKNSSMNE